MQQVRRKRRRIRMDRVLILIGAGLLSLVLIFGAIFGIYKLINPRIIADEYGKPNTIKLESDKINSNVYDEKNK